MTGGQMEIDVCVLGTADKRYLIVVKDAGSRVLGRFEDPSGAKQAVIAAPSQER